MTNSEKTALLLRISKLERKLKQLYGSSYSRIIQLEGVRNAIENAEADFSFDKHPDIEKQMEHILTSLNKETSAMVKLSVHDEMENGLKDSWDSIVTAVKGANAPADALKTLRKASEQIHRKNVAETYKKRELEIAKSVWSYTDQSKREMEVVIQNAIIQGRSAAQTATDLKKYLNNPAALFRRVKDKETGLFVLSKAAREYHPGAGVYRSAYQNALRLTRTETNNAYREGEWASYQDNPLVKGYRVQLSNNHTTKMPDGTVAALVDICDELQGLYPAWFKFRGWHPQCRCSMIPVTLAPAEFGEYRRAKEAGKLDEWKAKQKQVDLPKNFKKWVTNHEEEIAEASKNGKLPYFVNDNYSNVYDIIKPTVQNVEPWKRADLPKFMQRDFRSIDDVAQALDDRDAEVDKSKRWSQHPNTQSGRSFEIEEETNESNMGSTNKAGTIWLRKEIADECLAVFREISIKEIGLIKKDSLFSIGILWHEITHNRFAGDLMRTRMLSNSKNRQFMELANEFVSRNTIDEFLKELGCGDEICKSAKSILQNNPKIGYNGWVLAYKRIIDRCGLDMNEVAKSVKDGLFFGDYTKQNKNLADALVKNGAKKYNGKPMTKEEANSLVSCCLVSSEELIDLIMKQLGIIKVI